MSADQDFEELFSTEFTRMTRSLGLAFEPESAADAVQDAFVEADRRWNKVRSYPEPARWVWRVAYNRLLNSRRTAASKARAMGRLSASVRSTDAIDTVELVDLRRAIADLPQAMRSCVALYYLADMSVDDVAGMLVVSPGTVKSNLHDARRALRRSLVGVRKA